MPESRSWFYDTDGDSMSAASVYSFCIAVTRMSNADIG